MVLCTTTSCIMGLQFCTDAQYEHFSVVLFRLRTMCPKLASFGGRHSLSNERISASFRNVLAKQKPGECPKCVSVQLHTFSAGQTHVLGRNTRVSGQLLGGVACCKMSRLLTHLGERKGSGPECLTFRLISAPTILCDCVSY